MSQQQYPQQGYPVEGHNPPLPQRPPHEQYPNPNPNLNQQQQPVAGYNAANYPPQQQHPDPYTQQQQTGFTPSYPPQPASNVPTGDAPHQQQHMTDAAPSFPPPPQFQPQTEYHPQQSQAAYSNLPPSSQAYTSAEQHGQYAAGAGAAAGVAGTSQAIPPYNPAEYAHQQQQNTYVPPPPPQRIHQTNFGDDDPSNPIHYTRDPHKLVAYLVPFPKPQMKGIDPSTVPVRFLIYTPPPPPLSKPAEGEKEAKLHKVQRKWQEEVRSAKTSTAKTASWQGLKSKATKGISWAMNQTTNSNLDFLGRVSDGNKSDSDTEKEGPETHKTVGVEEMVLIYPPSMTYTPEQMREEFVNTMLRTKSKAQKDAIIATGLMPVAYGIDILATLVWPFGGLGEIDTVWAYSSFRGAKTARSVTKRLSSSTTNHNPSAGVVDESSQLKLTFTPSPRIDVLDKYMWSECHKSSPKLFPAWQSPPTETDVLEAIGWHPSQTGGENKNWEDEQWEMTEVKDDLKNVMHKGAKEWGKWCVAYEKDPAKAMKK